MTSHIDKFLACYNTDLPLWVGYFKNYPDVNMTINEGHVINPEGEVLARFPTHGEAMQTIRQAREEASK